MRDNGYGLAVADAHRGDYVVPSYLPDVCQGSVPWMKKYAARIAQRTGVDAATCWDEAVSAALRANLAFKQGSGTFVNFLRTCVSRGVARYAVRGALAQCRHGRPVALEDVCNTTALHTAGPEDLLLAHEAAERAFVLRAHADLAAVRDDDATARALEAAAAAAERTACPRT